MTSMDYNYTIEDEANLDDYDFEDFEDNNDDEEKILVKPLPGPLKFSTRTVNISIFPVVDYEKRIKYINNEILPNLFIKYEINIEFTDEILKKIILYRIIKDSIPY
jgi:hypothetical protein